MLTFDFLNFSRWLPASPTMRRRLQQTSVIEYLEVRSLLTGFAWSDATSLTISFAQDGTDIAGNSNELNAGLNHLGTPEEWQGTIVSAFQSWLNDLGFNIAVVSDSGDRFGINGATHADTRFGDIRVGAVPLTSGVLATAIPQNELISGTWSGDMILNSNVALNSLDELYALSLHEAGHILGLEHSPDPYSPMFDHGGTTVLAPTAGDLEMLRNLYGQGGVGTASAEQDDDENGVSEDAERIAPAEPSGMFPRFEVSGRFTSAGDVDTYVFRASDVTSESPELTTIVLRTESPTLVARVSLATVSGQMVEATVIANGNGLFVLQSRDIEADEDYIISVQPTGSAPSLSQGKYELAVTFSESAPLIEKLAKGTLDREKPQQMFDLYSAKSQLLNFQLATTGSNRRASASVVVMSVYNESQRLIFRAVAKPGDTVTDNTVLLGEGKYVIIVEAVATTTRSIPEIEFQVRGSIVSHDAGPLPRDPTGNPASGGAGNIPYVYPNNMTSSRPFNVQRPATPVVLFPQHAPVAWPQLLLNYPWLVGG